MAGMIAVIIIMTLLLVLLALLLARGDDPIDREHH